MIGRVLKLPCGEATIVPNHEEGYAGYSNSGARDLTTIWEHWYDELGKCCEEEVAGHAQIIYAMAGAEAEWVVLGKSTVGDGSDRHEIETVGYKLVGDDLTIPGMDTVGSAFAATDAAIVPKAP